jgi:hypothetical protein
VLSGFGKRGFHEDARNYSASRIFPHQGAINLGRQTAAASRSSYQRILFERSRQEGACDLLRQEKITSTGGQRPEYFRFRSMQGESSLHGLKRGDG